MSRRFTRSGRRTVTRRATFWETVSSTVFVTLTDGATVSQVLAIVTENELDNVPNPTLVRVRGQIFSRLGGVSNAQADCILVSHAIMVVDAKQFAIGVTALPLPLSSNSEDFLWFGTQFLAQNNSGTILNTNSNFDRLDVDSKAMRKITLNQVLVLVTEMELIQGSGGEDMQYAFNFRMLFKK